jgi:hypothetical protein
VPQDRVAPVPLLPRRPILPHLRRDVPAIAMFRSGQSGWPGRQTQGSYCQTPGLTAQSSVTPRIRRRDHATHLG